MRLLYLLRSVAFNGAILMAACAAAEEAVETKSGSVGNVVEIYDLSRLLSKSQRIVVAEIDTAQGDGVALKVLETLKAPENDPKYIDPRTYERAAALLAGDKAQPEAAPAAKTGAPGMLWVQIDKDVRLPPAGNQAVFFLWEAIVTEKGVQPKFGLAHPQCVYDMAVLPRVRTGLNNPRAIAPGTYLREWDRQMVAHLQERAADRLLREAKGGEAVMGLKIKALHVKTSLRGDNSFSVTAEVENTLSHGLDIYDGPVGGYGVILREKNSSPESAVVLRLQNKVEGVDNKVLELSDSWDFTNVAGHGALTKELFVDKSNLPKLPTLHGEYLIKIFYSNSHDGRGTELESAAWTGTMISEDVPLLFNYKQ